MKYSALRLFWLTTGWLSVGLGVIGIFLPLLPTTPFLLLAAYAFSRGSERLHTWLVEHPRLGPPINDWRAHRAVSRRSKITATGFMLALLGVSALLAVPTWALYTQAGVLCVVSVFLWRCNERPRPPV